MANLSKYRTVMYRKSDELDDDIIDDDEDDYFKKAKKLHKENGNKSMATPVLSGDDDEDDDSENDEEDEEELGYVELSKVKKTREENAKLRSELEKAGWTFKADGTPIPPTGEQKIEDSKPVYEFKLEEPPTVKAEFRQQIDNIKNLAPEQMREQPELWTKIYRHYHPKSSETLDEIPDWKLEEIKDRYVSFLGEGIKNDTEMFTKNKEATTKVNELRSKVGDEIVFQKYPEAVNILDEIVNNAKDNMSPLDISEHFDEFKDYAIGKLLRKNPEKLEALLEEAKTVAAKQERTKAKREQEAKDARRKTVGRHAKVDGRTGNGTNSNGRKPVYTKEILQKAKAAGMDPKEFVKFSDKKFIFS